MLAPESAMRPLVIGLTSLLVVVVAAGCGQPQSPQGLVVSAQSITGGFPTPDGKSTCFAICPAGQPAPPLFDPWNGSRGYILHGTIVSIDSADTVYMLIGLDPTMTHVVWQTKTIGDANLNWYLNLPGTIPFSCAQAVNIEAGQVGGGNTNTGGGNIGCEHVCFANDYLTNLQRYCQCNVVQTPGDACASHGAECGPSYDYCKNPVQCGSCPARSTCQGGSCSCVIRHCPKGMYLNADCGCESGVPI